MKFVNLGNTELTVTDFCLGTMTWGEQTDEVDAHKQIEMSLDAGINFIDTAEMYPVCPLRAETTGDTERILGNWLGKNSQKRKELVIATKISGKGYKNVRNGKGIFPKEIRLAIVGSLKYLQTDYIDLYQMHWPDRDTNFFGKLAYYHAPEKDGIPIAETLAVLDGLVKQGKIRELGLSNETPWGVSKYLELAKEKNLPRMMSIQNPYSLLNRTYEIGLAEVSIRDQIGLLAYSPLASGYLSGKYRNETYPKGSRMERDWEFWKYRYNTPNLKNAVEEYYKISKKYNLDMSQMSIKFCELQPFMTSVIIGATTMEQLKTDIESVNVNLSDEVIKEINEVQKIYPNPCP